MTQHSSIPKYNYAKVPTIGYWVGDSSQIHFNALTQDLLSTNLRNPLFVVFDEVRNQIGFAAEGSIQPTMPDDGSSCMGLVALLPGLYPEWLGDRSFCETHRLRFPYVGGAMARGISSTAIVIQLAKMGAMAFFGSAGLHPDTIEKAIDEIEAALSGEGLSWGCNLIHSPNEPAMEQKLVDLYLRRKVRRVSASAFMKMTKPVVQYACTGLFENQKGDICRTNYLFGKISREEVARHFLSPAPQNILDELVKEGLLTPEEARLAIQIPLAEDITVESDSGGHTDNRPLNALFPTIRYQANRLAEKLGYKRPIRLGAAGSLGTPLGVAAAFALGASYVLTGSVHQAAIESGVSDISREMLSQARLTDVVMTASADMFELGVKVQVLKRGTLMGVRGNRLYDIYTRYDSIDDIPEAIRSQIEEQIFCMPLEDVWKQTEAFFQRVDPSMLEKAAKDPKKKMALIFRWYIGNSSRWSVVGEKDRQADYQIWCGPAMGAFNSWVEGSFLEPVGARKVQQIALNLLEGATLITRANQLRAFGVAVDQAIYNYRPVPLKL